MSQVISMSVPIPNDFRVISDSEYQALKESELKGKAWGMKDLRGWLNGKSVDWIKENILFNPRFADEIGQMEKAKLIIRSKGSGNPWRFKAQAMQNFLEKHWQEFNW